MPDPGKYKDKAKYMEDCMHQTRKVEKKPQDQAVAVCLSRWRDENGGKKPSKKRSKGAFEVVREIATKIGAYA